MTRKAGPGGRHIRGAYNQCIFMGGYLESGSFTVVHILFVCRLSFFSAKRLRHLQVVQLSLETLMRNVHRVLLAPFVTVLPRMPWNSAMGAFGRHL